MLYIYRKATMQDAPAVLELYRSLLGMPGTTWDTEYPSMEFIEDDIRKDGLYLLTLEDGQILSAASLLPDEELNDLPFWRADIQNPCELSRFGARSTAEHPGIGSKMLENLIQIASVSGFDGMRLLAGPENERALALYRKMGFCVAGNATLYELEWVCMEKVL